jgi:hypothetical protein
VVVNDASRIIAQSKHSQDLLAAGSVWSSSFGRPRTRYDRLERSDGAAPPRVHQEDILQALALTPVATGRVSDMNATAALR